MRSTIWGTRAVLRYEIGVLQLYLFLTKCRRVHTAVSGISKRATYNRPLQQTRSTIWGTWVVLRYGVQVALFWPPTNMDWWRSSTQELQYPTSFVVRKKKNFAMRQGRGSKAAEAVFLPIRQNSLFIMRPCLVCKAKIPEHVQGSII